MRFRALSVSEANAEYQDVIAENHGDSIDKMFDDINKQIEAWDHESQDSPDVGVTGSPCNPFSSQRCKRFLQGNVASHTSYETTMRSVVAFYESVAPKLGITEQVRGFDQPFYTGCEQTPKQLLLT